MKKVRKEKKKKRKRKEKEKGEPEEPLVTLPKEITPPQSLTVFFASNTTQLAYEHPEHQNGLLPIIY